MAKATLVSSRFSFDSVSIPGPPSPNTLPLLRIYAQKPRLRDWRDCFFWSGATAAGLLALLFAHLCRCSRKYLWDTVRWLQSKSITTDAWAEEWVCHSSVVNHHTPGKAHAMGFCCTAVTILLKELLGHGLPTHNERDTSLLSTLDALLWDHISEACDLDQSLCCKVKWLKPRLYLRHWVSIRFLFQVHLHPIHSLSFKITSMNTGLSGWDRNLQDLVQHQRKHDCFFWPCYLHIFAAVAANISETRCDGCSQGWSQLMVHEQLLEPLVRQGTYHGLLWHSCDHSDHSLEGVAWSPPVARTRNALVFCWAPLTCSLGIRLQSLPLGLLGMLRTLRSWCLGDSVSSGFYP